MDGLAIQNLLGTIQIVEDYRYKVEWLLQLCPAYKAVANFGCNIGHETIALSWLLNAEEAIGIDKGANHIRQAQSKVRTIVEDTRSTNQYLHYDLIQDNDAREAVQNLLQLFSGKVAPIFVENDAANAVDLKDNHFDLVYCERFLYHFACATERNTQEQIVSVVQEMKRVTKSGGLITAIEPRICSPADQRPVDLTRIFDQVGLEKVDVSEINPHIDYEVIYVYKKER
jgi:SAM-dependent methyltransferase